MFFFNTIIFIFLVPVIFSVRTKTDLLGPIEIILCSIIGIILYVVYTFSSNYLVLDLQKKCLYSIQKILGFIPVMKTKEVFFKDINAVGTQNGLYGKNDKQNAVGGNIVLFGKQKTKEEKERYLASFLGTSIVALSHGKIVELTTPDKSNKKYEEYSKMACALANILGVPCSLSNKTQKLIVGRDSDGKPALVVAPFFSERALTGLKDTEKFAKYFAIIFFVVLFLVIVLTVVISSLQSRG